MSEGTIPLSDGRRDPLIVAGTLAASTAYATLRYNVFKGVAWSDWPHYTVNKSLALASLVLLAWAVLRLAAGHRRTIRMLMAFASGLAVTHSLVSLALLEPQYYEAFYATGRLTLAAGVSLTLASAAVALLQWGKGTRADEAPRKAIFALAAIAFISGLHAALPSIPNWLAPARWPGGMPPITLISFLTGLLALLAAARWALIGRQASAEAGS